MPLSDRDYMRTRPPVRESYVSRGYQGFSQSPIWIIIGINFLILIATFIGGKVYFSCDANIFGPVYKLNYYMGLMPADFGPRAWSIVTSMFAHAGLVHFIGNMLVLFFFGRFLTMLVGHKKFLWVYLGGGIIGNILYLLLGLLQNPCSIAVGASGAIYAIAGVLVVLTPRLRVYLYFIVPMPLWVVVLVFFVLWSFVPGVAWEAHIGGLITGLIAGYFFKKHGGYFYYR